METNKYQEEITESGIRMSEVVDVHKKKGITPDYDIYIGRKVRWVDWTYDSKWGNNFYADLEAYERHIRFYLWDELDQLEGQRLGCWCINTKKLTPVKCHGQILMKLLREKNNTNGDDVLQ